MNWITTSLEYIAQNELCFVVPLIPAPNFVSFCNDREAATSLDHLERLDRTGFWGPLARFERKQLKLKIQKRR